MSDPEKHQQQQNENENEKKNNFSQATKENNAPATKMHQTSTNILTT